MIEFIIQLTRAFILWLNRTTVDAIRGKAKKRNVKRITRAGAYLSIFYYRNRRERKKKNSFTRKCANYIADSLSRKSSKNKYVYVHVVLEIRRYRWRIERGQKKKETQNGAREK